jgi:hypothetical protein
MAAVASSRRSGPELITDVIIRRLLSVYDFIDDSETGFRDVYHNTHPLRDIYGL